MFGPLSTLFCQLFVAQLLAPLNGSGLIACGLNSGPNATGTLHRDALPSLAQCVTELLADLPVNTPPGQPVSPTNVSSLTMAVDRLLAAVKVIVTTLSGTLDTAPVAVVADRL